MEPYRPVLGPHQPHPLLRRALPQMGGGGGGGGLQEGISGPLLLPEGRDELQARSGFSISQQQDSW